MAEPSRAASKQKGCEGSFAPVLCIGLLLFAALVSVAFGSEQVSLGAAIDGDHNAQVILLRFRLPRVALAGVAGGSLAVVGAAFQALLRNPLAEPYVLGVSGGAALGATTMIALGVGLGLVGWVATLAIPLAAFLGGLAATALVYVIAKKAPQGPSGASILLAGIMVNAMASAFITVSKLLVSPIRAQMMLRWLVGFVELPDLRSLALVSVVSLLACSALWLDAGKMNLLALGDASATSLGVSINKLERRVFLASSLVVGAVVSVTGLIGFVGLIVPHAVRRLAGPDHRRLLPLCFTAGAALLMMCDLATRLAFRLTGQQLPVGVLTALIGGPLFISILLARSKR